jgi:speckle-type POZ protein
VLRISCYSATKASGKKCFKSGKFNVGGHTWYIAYYPAGYNECTGFISVYLFLDEAAARDAAAAVAVNARFKLGLVRFLMNRSYPRIITGQD